MIPTVFTSSFYFFQGPRRVYSAAVVGSIASIAPTLGPVIGGWITDTLNWHWLFYINLMPGIAITVLVPMLVRIDEPDLSLLRGADYPGIVLMAIGLGHAGIRAGGRHALELVQRRDDPHLRLDRRRSLVLFVVRSLTYRHPVVDLRALGNRNFALGCLLSFVTGVGIFTTIYLTPLFLGYVRGFSAWQTGTAIFSTGVASLIGTPIYILLARKFDRRWLMMFGLALLRPRHVELQLHHPRLGRGPAPVCRKSCAASRRCSRWRRSSTWASAACRRSGSNTRAGCST